MRRPTARWHRPERAAAVLLATLIAALGLAMLLLHLRGGAWYVVETPSMGTAAPVGTLVVSAPVRTAALRVGDVVTYTPPAGYGSTVTHRVVAAGVDGVRTRGDVNGGDDPWLLTSAQVRGRAVALLPGLGWLIRSLPFLLGGLALVLAVGALVRDVALRTALRLVCASAVVCGVVLALRPLVNAAVMTVVASPTGTLVRVIGTGLLPVRVSSGSRSVDVVSGQPAVLHLPAATAGRIDLTTAPHLEPWGWGVFTAVCAVPLLIAVLRARRREGDG